MPAYLVLVVCYFLRSAHFGIGALCVLCLLQVGKRSLFMKSTFRLGNELLLIGLLWISWSKVAFGDKSMHWW